MKHAKSWKKYAYWLILFGEVSNSRDKNIQLLHLFIQRKNNWVKIIFAIFSFDHKEKGLKDKHFAIEWLILSRFFLKLIYCIIHCEIQW